MAASSHLVREDEALEGAPTGAEYPPPVGREVAAEDAVAAAQGAAASAAGASEDLAARSAEILYAAAVAAAASFAVETDPQRLHVDVVSSQLPVLPI